MVPWVSAGILPKAAGAKGTVPSEETSPRSTHSSLLDRELEEAKSKLMEPDETMQGHIQQVRPKRETVN